jgi:hypothetical protein
MAESEIALKGGRVTAGVVRLGDTVRRPVTSDRSKQQALLLHLEHVGFDGTPRFLGIDEQGREILSYLSGDVPDDLIECSDQQITAAAQLLRRFHDATLGFPLLQASGGEVMCHNDWSPTNAVFRSGLPYALIDFDTVAPGPRSWDLGYSAFTWLDLGNDDYDGAEQIRRLQVFTDAYGLESCDLRLVARQVLARQKHLAQSARVQGKVDLEKWSASAAEWTARHVVKPLEGVLG